MATRTRSRLTAGERAASVAEATPFGGAGGSDGVPGEPGGRAGVRAGGHRRRRTRSAGPRPARRCLTQLPDPEDLREQARTLLDPMLPAGVLLRVALAT